jgi:hypothetical protein
LAITVVPFDWIRKIWLKRHNKNTGVWLYKFYWCAIIKRIGGIKWEYLNVKFVETLLN